MDQPTEEFDFDDYEHDLWTQAEFTKKVVPTKPTVRQAEGRSSIYEDNDHPDVQTEYKQMRGRWVRRPQMEVKPGIDENWTIREDIMKVTGIGMSNAFIEKAIKQNYVKQDIPKQESSHQRSFAFVPVSDVQQSSRINLKDEKEFPQLKK